MTSMFRNIVPIGLALAFAAGPVCGQGRKAGAGKGKGGPGGMVAPGGSIPPAAFVVRSPNGKLTVTFAVKDFEGATACPVYGVAWRGKTIIATSRLGLDLSGASLTDGFVVSAQTTGDHQGSWKPVYGERSVVPDNYRQLVVRLRQRGVPHRQLTLTFRAYDEGAAICYTIPKQEAMKSVRIKAERTEFRFPDSHAAWATYGAQQAYAKVPLNRIKPGCERPLTMETRDETYIALAEARLVDYARMKLAPLRGRASALVSVLDGNVELKLPATTPWRVVMVAESPGRLLENNFILLNLNDPCAIADTSWIKPGKVIRDVTLTTAGGKACVDFAAAHNLQYVEFDAGWYGREYDDSADARTVTVDPKRSPGPLDLHEVIRYAEGRGIGVILYVNRRALERQLDEILPLYRRWGVKGVKYGFVKVGSQKATRWLHEAVRKAAAHQLMVDIHDEYRPTGFERTYPNLMTAEGIRGDEATPKAQTDLTTLFTRMLAGPGDHTICYFAPRVERAWSHGFQLAKSVCIYSPWQFLYWYDRPGGSDPNKGGAGGSRRTITEVPELEFFDNVPTVWDETSVIHARIGCYAVIARRSGRRWFVGCMNAGKQRALDVPLGFLPAGTRYVAHIYSDDASAKTPTRVKVETRPVDSTTTLRVSIKAPGGVAIRLAPANEAEQEARNK